MIFGGLYGASVFGLYGFLSLIGAPRFYDKLLCVPPLNLMVRVLDKVGTDWMRRWLGFSRVSMHAIHLGCLATTVKPGFHVRLGSSVRMDDDHWLCDHGDRWHPAPGKDPAFWEQACNAIAQSVHRVGRFLNTECERDRQIRA